MSDYKAIRGILLSSDFDKLVIQATEADVQAFGQPGAPVGVASASTSLSTHDAYAALLESPYLYDSRGRAILLAMDVNISSRQIDVRSMGDSSQRFIAGPARLVVQAVGL